MRVEKITFVIALFVLLAAGACRSRSKSAKDTEPSVTLFVALKNIDDVDRSKAVALTPEIACNGEANWVGGSYANFASAEVEFVVKTLKVGDPCRVRLINQTPADELEFLAAPTVAYETDTAFPVGVRAGGQLWSEALLRRTYKLKAAARGLLVTVRFPEKMPTTEDGLIAELKCSPEFEGLAKGLTKIDQKAKTAVFRFDSGLKPGVKYQCQQIQISRGKSQQVYYGDFSESFTYDEGKDLSSQKTVELNEIEINHVSGVVILTAPGDACKENEYFDIETRQCKPEA